MCNNHVKMETDSQPHGLAKRYICSVENCSKAFSKPSRLLHHLRAHTGERPYRCPHPGCSKSYTRQAHLKRHEESHQSPQKPFTAQVFRCDIQGCGRTFVSPDSLKKHRKIVHSDESRYKCKQEGCERAFRKHHQLKAHQYEHKGVLPFQCHHQRCMKKFAQKGHLDRHLKIHDGYNCREAGCGQTFTTWSAMLKHNKSHVTGHHCHCGKSFVSACTLKYHQLIHQDTRERFRCPRGGCSKSYCNLRNLNAHLKAFHDGRKFHCQHAGCDKAFSSKQKLHLHVTLHDQCQQTDSKPVKTKPPRTWRTRKKLNLATKLTGVSKAELDTISSTLQVVDEGPDSEQLAGNGLGHRQSDATRADVLAMETQDAEHGSTVACEDRQVQQKADWGIATEARQVPLGEDEATNDAGLSARSTHTLVSEHRWSSPAADDEMRSLTAQEGGTSQSVGSRCSINHGEPADDLANNGSPTRTPKEEMSSALSSSLQLELVFDGVEHDPCEQNVTVLQLGDIVDLGTLGGLFELNDSMELGLNSSACTDECKGPTSSSSTRNPSVCCTVNPATEKRCQELYSELISCDINQNPDPSGTKRVNI